MGTHTIDCRGLAPPEPLERTLAALDSLAAEDELAVLLYCHPRPLFNILDRNGFRYETLDRPDGTVEVRIRAADNA